MMEVARRFFYEAPQWTAAQTCVSMTYDPSFVISTHAEMFQCAACPLAFQRKCFLRWRVGIKCTLIFPAELILQMKCTEAHMRIYKQKTEATKSNSLAQCLNWILCLYLVVFHDIDFKLVKVIVIVTRGCIIGWLCFVLLMGFPLQQSVSGHSSNH